MPSLLRIGLLVAAVSAAAACGGPVVANGDTISSVTLDGAIFEIADAAISSNCLSLTFAVRGYSLPPGASPQHGFPPTKRIDIRTGSSGVPLNAIPLGGGGGGGGNDEDGRVWMRQETLYALSEPIEEGTEIALELSVLLNDDYGIPDPLEYRVLVVAGPGGGFCPIPEAAR